MKKLLLNSILVLIALSTQAAEARNIAQEKAEKLNIELAQARKEIDRLVAKISKGETEKARLEAEAAHHDLHNRKPAQHSTKNQPSKTAAKR